MPLTSSDLIQPLGLLDPTLFPDTDLDTFVSVWLTEAQALTDSEARQRAWVYHRGYRTIADRLNAQVGGGREGEVSGYRLGNQFEYFSRLAEWWLRKFERVDAASVVF